MEEATFDPNTYVPPERARKKFAPLAVGWYQVEFTGENKAGETKGTIKKEADGTEKKQTSLFIELKAAVCDGAGETTKVKVKGTLWEPRVAPNDETKHEPNTLYQARSLLRSVEGYDKWNHGMDWDGEKKAFIERSTGEVLLDAESAPRKTAFDNKVRAAIAELGNDARAGRASVVTGKKVFAKLEEDGEYRTLNLSSVRAEAPEGVEILIPPESPPF